MSNADTDTISPAKHDATLATARAEARTATIERVRAILTSPDAKGREPQALILALDTDLTPEAAARALAAGPPRHPRARRSSSAQSAGPALSPGGGGHK